MGYKQDKNIPPMEREINYLLYDLCVIWGFCIPPKNSEEISKKTCFNAKEFATSILLAEGMNPDYEKKWIQKIATKFEERFGTYEIDKNTFIDRTRGIKETW